MWGEKSMIIIFLSGIFAFISTNLSDLFILMVWFSQTNNVLHKKHIVAGQYLGFTALVLLSLLVSLVALFIPKEWVGLLGSVPLYMAYKLWREHGTEENKEDVLSLDTQNKLEKISFLNVFTNQNTYRIASVTFADCADNISIYTQIFKSASLGELIFMISEFMLLVGVWCYIAFLFTKYSFVATTAEKYGHILLPFVLIFLGIYIFISSETYKLLGL